MRLIDADKAYEILTDFYHHKTEAQHEALREALGKVPAVLEAPVWPGDFMVSTSMPSLDRDIDWHLEHKRLGFYDPIAEVFEALMGKEGEE